MRLARSVFFCALVAFVATGCGPAVPPAGSYATIQGVVTDAGTGQPLAGVTVTYSVLSVTTGADGKYKLFPVPPGPITAVTASLQSYQGYTSAELTLAPGQVLKQDIALTHR